MDDSVASPSTEPKNDHPSTAIYQDLPELEEPSSSVALRQWPILEKIFSYCGAGNDGKSLLGARSVSKIWKSEAINALMKHDHLLPTLKVDGARLDSILQFIFKLDPSTDLPLKVVLIKWTSPQVELLRTYVMSIVSIELDFRGCPELDFGDAIDLNLPQLRHLKLRGCTSTSHFHRLDSPEVINGLKLLERLAQAGNVETCEVFMPPRYNNEAYDAASLPIPNQITGLYGLDSRLFDRLTAVREFPRLDKVALKGSDENQFSSEFLNVKPDQLKELSIDDELELFLSKPLGKLKSLTIHAFSSVGGSQPLPVLLPRLSRVDLTMESFDELTEHEEVFQNVSEFHFQLEEPFEHGDQIFQQKLNLYGATLKTAFPRLTNLQLELSLSLMDLNGISFYPLLSEGLKFLALYGNVSVADSIFRVDLVKLITNVTWEDIPRSEWASALVGKQDSITNLSRLQKLTMSLKIKRRDPGLLYNNLDENLSLRLSNDESEFLFRAAFENMASLKELQFKDCAIENETVKQEWRGSGKFLIEL